MQNNLCIDIETTGLFWRNSRITYIGTAYKDEERWIYKEWFLDQEEQEPDVLEAFGNYLDRFQQIFTYNGTGFDLPFLKHKFQAYDIPTTLEEKKHIDLLLKLRPYQRMLKLLSMKQMDLEFFMGRDCLERKPGDDLHGLTCLVPMLAYLQLQDPASVFDLKGKLEDDSFLITGMLKEELPKPISYSQNPFYLSVTNDRISMKIHLYQGELKCFFPDYKNYYYLPQEDKAIHKSIGTFVDKNHRIQAKAATCYQKTTGSYLPNLWSRQEIQSFENEFLAGLPLCKTEWEEKLSYLPVTEVCCKETFLREYLAAVLTKM